MSNTLIEADLEYMLDHTAESWNDVRNQRIFITGGTGFIGRWMLEAYAWANSRLNLNSSAVVLTRDPDKFRRAAPHLANHPAIRLLNGNIVDFEGPPGTFSHVVHAAADMKARRAPAANLRLFESIVWGTSHILRFATERRSGRLLYVSSGAVYGRQPNDLPGIAEEYSGAPDPLMVNATYGVAKRAAELLCASYARQQNFIAVIARGFTFFGTDMERSGMAYAIGDFMQRAIQGGPIEVKGDGRTLRSYLYGADMAIWLWTILLRGQNCRAYNVGSDQAISIADVAQQIASLWKPARAVHMVSRTGIDVAVERYVPVVQRARTELGLIQGIGLSDGLARWSRTALRP